MSLTRWNVFWNRHCEAPQYAEAGGLASLNSWELRRARIAAACFFGFYGKIKNVLAHGQIRKITRCSQGSFSYMGVL